MEMSVEMAAAARATTFSSVPERKREGGRVPVMKVRLILSCAKGEAGARCERHFEARQLAPSHRS